MHKLLKKASDDNHKHCFDFFFFKPNKEVIDKKTKDFWLCVRTILCFWYCLLSYKNRNLLWSGERGWGRAKLQQKFFSLLFFFSDFHQSWCVMYLLKTSSILINKWGMCYETIKKLHRQKAVHVSVFCSLLTFTSKNRRTCPPCLFKEQPGTETEDDNQSHDDISFTYVYLCCGP